MSENPTRHALEAELTERAWQDDAFRAELLNDPKAVIKRELARYGITLADDVLVHVHEETSSALHLVLPVNPEDQELELDDEALDLVAGGNSGEGSAYGGFECGT